MKFVVVGKLEFQENRFSRLHLILNDLDGTRFWPEDIKKDR